MLSIPPRLWLGPAILALSGLTALPAVQAQQPSAVDARAIWPERSLSACRTAQAEAVDTCLLRTMQKSGARPQAIAAAKGLVAAGNPGFISAWRPLGKAGLATVTYPFRANTNQGSLLVSSDGTAVDIDWELLRDEDRATDTWRTFASAHPDSLPFAPASFVGTTDSEDGGHSLLFSTPLKSCHACATDGSLLVSYEIDKEGVVRSRKLLAIK
ncbi:MULTISPECIES: hypothetical protein [unclassified Janthinobacterium]|uniref:hypothetical protein n=1 Tax=unclassified Janthinobacterium TaxID=2610881 RepID=UPI00160C77D9|nr:MULTISPECIES: hypothetical protein [unclassified Janthinobacterium]MBB5368350.1 hypothetical protein [Janthinobacterium sp. K2C7]MBB5382114.1 hypothetical protein [Janthinobacterium sp. K2Li3]MBB5386732.1 hypothetical protein [Janthinobacterium sp. K2E3]